MFDYGVIFQLQKKWHWPLGTIRYNDEPYYHFVNVEKCPYTKEKVLELFEKGAFDTKSKEIQKALQKLKQHHQLEVSHFDSATSFIKETIFRNVFYNILGKLRRVLELGGV